MAAKAMVTSYSLLTSKHNIFHSASHHRRPCTNAPGFVSENRIPIRPLSVSWSRPANISMKVFATSAATPVIPTSKSSPSDVPTVVDVDLGDRSYPIYIGSGLLNQPDLLQRY
ncbi:hypothetical protein OSB04_011416 [Centaurea solstitialis]|uniref:Uncharacterized protein n=1 Tax=Centaurea solstitialis TaxID=347529 RepID=A0AA38WDN5_9ASTR|nr:hypothetical protein OSB04_011416 [Centaurea solstitialis]